MLKKLLTADTLFLQILACTNFCEIVGWPENAPKFVYIIFKSVSLDRQISVKIIFLHPPFDPYWSSAKICSAKINMLEFVDWSNRQNLYTPKFV